MDALKSNSKRFPYPMVDWVWAHVKEMYEVGTIHPSQTNGVTWSN